MYLFVSHLVKDISWVSIQLICMEPTTGHGGIFFFTYDDDDFLFQLLLHSLTIICIPSQYF